VYNFLGNVNLFHGRVDGGKTYIHERETGTPGLCAAAPAGYCPAAQRRRSFPRKDQAHQRGRTAGKVEAITEWGALVHVEMPQDRFRTLPSC
jgi:hypothetical protein